MANTQGMSDEFVESLMNSTTRTSSSAAVRQRKWLQERMDMPLPQGGPAARIIRPSPQSQMQTEDSSEEEEDVQPSSQDREHAPPIVGSILERTPTTKQKHRVNQKQKTSRFSQSLNGFPSVHVPLGTFCQDKAKAPPKRSTIVTPTPTKLHPTITTESLLEASKREATETLQGMSREEIIQQQQELNVALSPEMIAFLKRRGGKERSKKGPDPTQSSNEKEVVAKKIVSTKTPKRNTREEKEQIAELMSKVQTHQDLDQAYRNFMEEPHPLDAEMQTNTEVDNFALACDLLRSTNSRQTLWAARVVHRRLSDLVQQHQNLGNHISRDWPLVLPVSLRCLLDQPIHGNAGYILHTYVLQSIHSLLLLTAHPDHIVRVLPIDRRTHGSVYADCFMDDAIPTPRLDNAYLATPVKPLTTTNDSSNSQDNSAPAAAYATQSSSTSANADGEAFDRDPMWTLLSKMKIVPRIAQLLTTTLQSYDWPPEAWVSTVGILCMIAQRSPGAATAIAHHEIILPRVIARILPCLQDQDVSEDADCIIAYAVFRLLGTLARQSRVTAQSLALADVLPPLLARTPNSSLEFQVQILGLHLWRTVLRYGLGLEAWESMATAAARHLALPYTHQYSLSTEFVSALSQVLECAKLVKLKGDVIRNSRDESKVHDGILSTLSMVGIYLASTQRTVILQPTTTISSSSVDSDNQCLQFRWNAARMRFLANYWNLAEVNESTPSDTTIDNVESEEWSMEQILTCLETMDEWTDNSSLVEMAWIRLGKYASSAECARGPMDAVDIECEAAASAFLDAFVQLLLSLAVSSLSAGNRMVQELVRSISKHFLERILEVLRKALMEPVDSSNIAKSSLAQRGWINQCHFAVSKIFSHCVAIGEKLSSGDLHLIRMMVFHLLGRLERGNESVAAILFSQDELFQASGNPVENTLSSTLPSGVTSSSSPISSMFLGELCGSETARKQLDHSFKLQHGFGVTREGTGAFSLNSLLSDAEQPIARSSNDISLPMGTLWLWQSLSGQIRTQEEQNVAQSFHEATNVVSAVLGLIMELEEGDDLMDFNSAKGYSSRIPLGAKLYYLMNVCLNTEEVLREDRVLHLAESVLERYWPRLDPSFFTLEFSHACLQHTDPSNKTANDDKLEDNDKKLLELFQPEIPNEASLSSEEMRSLEAFFDDMAEAYRDYGAQYEFFTKCIRLFLLPVFPSSIRCRALTELRGIFHLLTLPTESEDPNELQRLLCHSVSSGRDDPAFARAPTDFLDAVVSSMVPNNVPRPLAGYILAFSVAVVVRNFGMALHSNEGLEAMKKRLIQLDSIMINLIFTIMSNLNATRATNDDLVNATLKVLSDATNDTTQKISTLLSLQELNEQLEPYLDQFNK